MELRFRAIEPDDWDRVRQIYEQGLATGQATFETEPPDWDRWDAGHRSDCRLAAIDGSLIVAWAALAPFSPRAVYRGVAEPSLYVATAARGAGVGSALLGELVRRSELAGYWTLLAKVFPENRASLVMAMKHGFRRVGELRRLARHNGRWRDVVLLERRTSGS